MAKTKLINQNVEAVLATATRMADSFNQTYINTGHLFLGVLNFISNNSNTKSYLIRTKDRIKTTVNIYNADKIKPEDVENLTIKENEYWLYTANTHISTDHEILEVKEASTGLNTKDISEFCDAFLKLLDEYWITPFAFKSCFFIRNPKEKAKHNVEIDSDTGKENKVLTEQPDNLAVYKALSTVARETKRQQGIPDLIKALISDNDYELKYIFDELHNAANSTDQTVYIKPRQFTTEEIYKDITELCNKFIPECNGASPKVSGYADLDQISYLTNINKFVIDHPRKSYGLDGLIDNIEVQLCCQDNKSMALVGPSGCGKNEVVYTLAEKINKGEVSDILKGTLIYELNITQLVAGCSLRGDLEGKASKAFSTLAKHPNVILFIDKGEMLNGAGGTSEGRTDGIGNMIEPYLSRGEITAITAMESEDYKLLEDNKTLCSRFTKFVMEEPSDEITEAILNNMLGKKEEFYGFKANPDVIHSIISLGYKYEPSKANPRRSITLLDSAFAYAKKNGKNEVSVNDIKSYLSRRFNFTLSDNKAEDTYKELATKILGQEKALARIHENLQICDLGITDGTSPLYTMGFFGPTGTGKSETAHIIAKYYFGSDKKCVVINCSQLNSESGGSNLVGSNKGYVGYGESTPLSKVKDNPNCVVLFDEIEKASKEVRDTLLGGLNDGYIEMTDGSVVSLRNAIIIFTSNIGFTFDSFKATGAGLVKQTAGTTNVKQMLEDEFTPEFVGRINDLITFDYLSDAIIDQLINNITDEYKKTSNIGDVEIVYTDDELKEIKKQARIKESGARFLKQVVRRVLARKVLNIKKEVLA